MIMRLIGVTNRCLKELLRTLFTLMLQITLSSWGKVLKMALTSKCLLKLMIINQLRLEESGSLAQECGNALVSSVVIVSEEVRSNGSKKNLKKLARMINLDRTG